MGDPIENLETWAFLTPPLRELGPALGLWEPRGSGIALMVPVRDDRRGESAALDPLNVSFRLSRDVAAQLNGRSGADDRRIVAVGAGALGSQVILSSARAAFGRWTIIDHDRLLPHNAARHALGEVGVGHHKAVVLASVANQLMDDEPAFEAIVADVLAPGPRRQDIEDRFTNADLIVDLAASIPVARYLAGEAPGAARRVSFFLNPDGTDLVMLAACLPSGDDLNVLSWLTTQMDTDGVPGVMMIACDRDQLAVLLAQVAHISVPDDEVEE